MIANSGSYLTLVITAKRVFPMVATTTTRRRAALAISSSSSVDGMAHSTTRRDARPSRSAQR